VSTVFRSRYCTIVPAYPRWSCPSANRDVTLHHVRNHSCLQLPPLHRLWCNVATKMLSMATRKVAGNLHSIMYFVTLHFVSHMVRSQPTQCISNSSTSLQPAKGSVLQVILRLTVRNAKMPGLASHSAMALSAFCIESNIDMPPRVCTACILHSSWQVQNSQHPDMHTGFP
jgi:hypothetical protein